jgi:PAS domain S-box-containing protein
VRTTSDEDFTSFLNANESTFEYNIGETEQSIIDILNSYMTTHSYVNSVYMGRENGTFVRSHPRASPTQYDPRERPWYTLGKENPGQVMITEPYESVTTTDINIGVVTALVGDNGEVYGVLGADITLNDLTEYMSDFEVGYQGHMLLTDENGTIVAFSDSQFLFENLEALLGDAATDIMSQSNGVMTVETESGSFYLYLYTSPELGWKLAVMAPTGVVNGVIQGPVFIALFGLFIALALLSLLTFFGLNISVINPLKRLSEVTLDIANRGDLSHKTGINTKNEIGALAASFDRMTDTLRTKEEALSTSEMRYRRLFEEAQDGILLLDAETGEIINVNPYLVELLGYSHEQFTGKSIWELGTFKDIVPDRDSYLELQRQEYIRYDDLPLTTGDGRQIYVEFISNSYIAGQKKLMQCTIRNTTERKRAEEKLRLEEQRFRALADQSSDIIVLVNKEGKIIYENPAIESILGLKVEERIGASVFEHLHPDDLQIAADAFKKLSMDADAPVQRSELRLRHKDGSWHTFEAVGSNLVKDNVVEAVIINLRDITERKMAEESLRESEAKYRFLTEKMNDVVWTLDMDLKTTYVSPSVTNMLGYTPEERMKQPVTEQLTPESLNAVTQALSVELGRDGKDGVDPDRQLTVLMECYHKNGSIIWMEALVSAIRDENGKIIGIHGVSRDVTERKRAEEALRNSEEKLQTMFKSMNDGVLVCDSNINIVDVNEATLRILGLETKDGLIGRNVLDVVKFKDQETVAANLLRMLKERISQVQGEYCALLPDGKEMEVDVITSAMYNDAGRQVGFINVIRDITERKQAEKALLLYKEHLEELVKERTSELDKAKIAAEAANKAKSDFLANMSHEIRTPLSTIIGFSELLYDETKGPLNNDQKKYMGYVTSAGEHLLSLINDVLDLSKVEAGKMELMTTSFSVSDVLKNSLSFIAEKALKHNIKLLSDISSDVGMIEADERKVKQILYNLLSNAVKFTPDGGTITLGAVIVSPDSTALPADIRKGLTDTRYVLVSVKDTGIGIAKKDQAKLFTEFYQIEEPYAKKYEGTGLGLALSKRLVALHGGKIWFESKGKDKGSTFYFILPSKPLPKT